MVVTSLPPVSRPLRDGELQAVVKVLDGNGDAVLQASELAQATTVRKALDTNHNGRIEATELVRGLKTDQLTVSLSRRGAIQVLLSFDTDRDGYLSQDELALDAKASAAIDGYGAAKFAIVNGATYRDGDGRPRTTGQATVDGRISLSEMANAIADGRLTVGRCFYANGSLT